MTTPTLPAVTLPTTIHDPEWCADDCDLWIPEGDDPTWTHFSEFKPFKVRKGNGEMIEVTVNVSRSDRLSSGRPGKTEITILGDGADMTITEAQARKAAALLIEAADIVAKERATRRRTVAA
jgi:hypothetical protein